MFLNQSSMGNMIRWMENLQEVNILLMKIELSLKDPMYMEAVLEAQ